MPDTRLSCGSVAGLVVADGCERLLDVRDAAMATQPQRGSDVEDMNHLLHGYFDVFFRSFAACSDAKAITTNAIVM